MMRLTLKRQPNRETQPRSNNVLLPKTGGALPPIRFEDRARGLQVTAHELKLLSGNRVLLTKCEIWQDGDTGTPQRIQGERVLLTLDAPVIGIEDLRQRKIVSIHVDGGAVE